MKIGYMLDDGAKVPEKAHITDGGFDICTNEDGVVMGCSSRVFHTGVHVELPRGFCGLLVSKSGLNVKHGITTTGLIDFGYTGEILVNVYNNSPMPYASKAGDKISQLIVLPVPGIEMEEIKEFAESERGNCGFGSTGR